MKGRVVLPGLFTLPRSQQPIRPLRFSIVCSWGGANLKLPMGAETAD